MGGKTPLSARSRQQLVHARGMRREMTMPERRLWSALRGDALGVRVRRQVPLGPFIADFYVPAGRLVIEVDGGTHDRPGADAGRDAWFGVRGVRVMRVRNEDVMGNLAGVLEGIVGMLNEGLGGLG